MPPSLHPQKNFAKYHEKAYFYPVHPLPSIQFSIGYTILLYPANDIQSLLLLFVLSGEVLREVISQLRRARFPIDLGSLARVEEMIVDKFGAPNFDSLGNGSFLSFVASHDKACEALGGRLIGTNSSSSHIAGVKKKVMSIIRQLKFDKRDDQVC